MIKSKVNQDFDGNVEDSEPRIKKYINDLKIKDFEENAEKRDAIEKEKKLKENIKMIEPKTKNLLFSRIQSSITSNEEQSKTQENVSVKKTEKIKERKIKKKKLSIKISPVSLYKTGIVPRSTCNSRNRNYLKEKDNFISKSKKKGHVAWKDSMKQNYLPSSPSSNDSDRSRDHSFDIANKRNKNQCKVSNSFMDFINKHGICVNLTQSGMTTTTALSQKHNTYIISPDMSSAAQNESKFFIKNYAYRRRSK